MTCAEQRANPISTGTIGPLRAPLGKVGTSAEFKASSAHLQDLGITTIEEVNRDAFARQLPPNFAYPIDAEVLLENPPDVDRQLGVPLRPFRQAIRITCCKIRLLFW